MVFEPMILRYEDEAMLWVMIKVPVPDTDTPAKLARLLADSPSVGAIQGPEAEPAARCTAVAEDTGRLASAIAPAVKGLQRPGPGRGARRAGTAGRRMTGVPVPAGIGRGGPDGRSLSRRKK